MQESAVDVSEQDMSVRKVNLFPTKVGNDDVMGDLIGESCRDCSKIAALAAMTVCSSVFCLWTFRSKFGPWTSSVGDRSSSEVGGEGIE
jgi:hypothetical protein